MTRAVAALVFFALGGCSAQSLLATDAGRVSVERVQGFLDTTYCGRLMQSDRQAINEAVNPTPEGNEIYIFCRRDPGDFVE